METWEPVLLPWFSSFRRSFSAFSFSISSCRQETREDVRIDEEWKT